MNASEYLGSSNKVYTVEELSHRLDRLTKLLDAIMEEKFSASEGWRLIENITKEGTELKFEWSEP